FTCSTLPAIPIGAGAGSAGRWLINWSENFPTSAVAGSRLTCERPICPPSFSSEWSGFARLRSCASTIPIQAKTHTPCNITSTSPCLTTITKPLTESRSNLELEQRRACHGRGFVEVDQGIHDEYHETRGHRLGEAPSPPRPFCARRAFR